MSVLPMFMFFGSFGLQSPSSREYYVAPGGSDDVSCYAARNPAAPRRTIRSAAACLRPGDTLLVREGLYPESLDDVIPAGSSWESPVTVAAYPGEHVLVRPHSGQFVFQAASGAYIVLDGLVLDGVNVEYDAVEITIGARGAFAHHIRLANTEIRNAPRSGVGIHQGRDGQRTDYNEFINVAVHDNGSTDFHHGLYIESSHNLIDGCRIYNNSGWGVHVYTGFPGRPVDANTVRNSVIHDNARSGTRGVGIGIYNGEGNVAHENVIYNNAGGIAIDYGASRTRIWKNTIYNNNRGAKPYGIYNGDNSDKDRAGAVNSRIWNNVLYGHARDFINARADADVANNAIGAARR